MPDDGLGEMLMSWEIALRAEGKSKNTVKVYGDGVRAYMRWQEQAGVCGLTKEDAARFLAELIDSGTATTASIRAKNLRQFSTWAYEEGRLEADVLAGLKAPRPDKIVVPKLTDDELRRLIAACAADKTVYGRRDEAMVRLTAEAGCRAEELLGMDLPDDISLKRGIAVIRRGKGARGRFVPFGSQTARAVDRYMFLRRRLVPEDTGPLWVSQRRGRLGYHGMYATLIKRAEAAGISDFHPHRLRHTFASRWLAAGGSEGGLMAVAGWTSREMLDRYAADTRSELAAEEARRLSLGEM